ncbi:MAG TPA: LemA family protein [Terrimicrobium sp.]
MGMALVILVAIVCGLGLFTLFAVGQYNTLVALRNRYKNTFSQIDGQLKIRYDLIANMVEGGKDYLEDDRETLDTVTSARNSAYSTAAKAAANPGHPQAIRGLIAAEARLKDALERFFAVAETNPGLNADPNLSRIGKEVTSLENKISFAREAYNDAVMIYNVRREVFPANVVASMFGFAAAELFQMEALPERAGSKVSLT